MASSHSTQTPNQNSSEIAPEFVPDTAADYRVPPTKLEQLKSSNWRPVAAFAGALLVGGLLMPLVIGGGKAPENTQAVSSWELALPASSTMVTQLSAAPGAPIRGQISPVADITGHAPTGGAVARWSVQPGTSVRAGQDVVQISSGAASAAPLPGESRQIQAEEQQTAAADDQMDLAKRLTSTQQKLAAAQSRVEAAQQNIAKTRAIIANLRAGDAATGAVATPPAPRRKASSSSLSGEKIAAARAATKNAQASFNSTKAQLDTARADLSAAQKSLAPLQSRLDDAQKNVTAIEAKFDGSLASASDVQAARSARDNAKSTLKSATLRLENAQKQIPTLEKQLATRERAADDARRAQNAVIAAAPDQSNADDSPAPVANNNASNNAMSVEDAANLVDAALAESRAATREADKLRAQIDAYQAQAQQSNQRITRATEQLQNAQLRAQSQVVQSVPRVRFTAATAPASGVVVWIATLAREVGAGQSVFGIASGKKYRARFEDRTDGWKNARVGQIVNALLAPPTQTPAPAVATPAPKPSASDAGSPPMPVLVAPAPASSPAQAATRAPELNGSNAVQQGATPVKVRLTRITPPASAGAPAILEGELVGANGSAGPNSRLLASLPNANAPTILAVPDSALVQRDGAWMVAVIESEAQPQTEVTPASDQKAAPNEAQPVGILAWREVQVGEGDGIARRVKVGLKAGERIVTDPLPLIAQAPPESKTMPRVKLAA